MLMLNKVHSGHSGSCTAEHGKCIVNDLAWALLCSIQTTSKHTTARLLWPLLPSQLWFAVLCCAVLFSRCQEAGEARTEACSRSGSAC
jgi:hypothetical protein